MIKLLYESYAVQNQLYTKNFKRKILLNMVIQIEKPIDKRVNLRELLSANLCQLTFETMPQFCLQLYLVFVLVIRLNNMRFFFFFLLMLKCICLILLLKLDSLYLSLNLKS